MMLVNWMLFFLKFVVFMLVMLWVMMFSLVCEFFRLLREM